MSRAARLAFATLLTAATIAAATSAQTGPPQQTPPVFRSRSTSVSVDVSVRNGNNTVTGLTPADFLLTDNGVTQTVELVDVDSVPVDISLVVDISGSTAGQLSRYKADVEGIAKTIRPQDRLRVITFGTDAKQVMALQYVKRLPEFDDFESGSSSSVYDGVAAALLRRIDLDRRHLIVAFTDGLENSSILTLDMLMQIAKQSEAVLHLSGNTASALDAVAQATGGANHAPPPATSRVNGIALGGDLPGGSMLGDFKKIFEDFRQSYVLRYRPTGVAADGWHDLKVTLARRGRFTIHARRGYFGG